MIAGAPADIAVYGVSDFRFARIRIASQQVYRAEYHAWRAESALKAMLLPEAFLHRVHFSVLCDSLDGCDGTAVGLGREHSAGFNGPPVENHRACAALARVTTDVSSRESERFAQIVDEERTRLHLVLLQLPVYFDTDVRHL